MSGLVNGLQNRLQQFESARHLTKRRDCIATHDAVLSSFFGQRTMDYGQQTTAQFASRKEVLALCFCQEKQHTYV